MTIKGLNELIDTYKDFPKKGIEFKDVLGIIQDPGIQRTYLKNVVKPNY